MMNRILKRPMFRMGGSSGTGITSGLDKPRQNYQTAGSVRPGGGPNMFDVAGPLVPPPAAKAAVLLAPNPAKCPLAVYKFPPVDQDPAGLDVKPFNT